MCTGKKKKPGFWHMFPLPNLKMANEPWHMLAITCLDPPDVLLESLKPQKMGRSVATFPRKNDDNLMDVGFQFKHVLQVVVWIILDMFGLRISATLCGNHETLAGPASISSNLNLLPLSGSRLQK